MKPPSCRRSDTAQNPYDTCVAILGNGQTAKGAMRILHGLGARVDVYSHRLEQLFRKNMFDYDVLINCVMWDTTRTDRIIYKEDLKKMKPGTLIIDVSCDPHLEIETSHPTTIDDPVYVVDGVIHYAVDNTPAMYPITVTKVLSEGISNYIDIIYRKGFRRIPGIAEEGDCHKGRTHPRRENSGVQKSPWGVLRVKEND